MPGPYLEHLTICFLGVRSFKQDWRPTPGSGRGGSVGRSFRPQKLAPRCARQVGRSGSKSLENGRKRLKRLKKSSRPAPRGQKTKEGRSDGGFRPKKTHVSFSRRASLARWVGRSGQTESETQNIAREGRTRDVGRGRKQRKYTLQIRSPLYFSEFAHTSFRGFWRLGGRAVARDEVTLAMLFNPHLHLVTLISPYERPKP